MTATGRGPRPPLLLLLLLLAGCALVTAAPKEQRVRRGLDLRDPAHGNAKDFRLPDGARPLAYRLHLRADPEPGRFSGRVAINVTCDAPTRAVTLHVHESLQVAHHQVRLAPASANYSGPTISVSSTNKELGRQWYVVTLSSELVPGHVYQLELPFSGRLVRDRSAGFFVNSYEAHRSHEPRYFAATQMRPNMARSIFPCFDGPMYKATFDVSIERPRGLRALSNMPLRHTAVVADDPAWEVDHFETTPPMSTFSLAAVVCDLGIVTPKKDSDEQDPKPAVSVYGRSHLLSQLEKAADRVPAIVRWLEAYFGVAYPLAQLQLVALPHYSSTTPADMFGVVIFREQDLVSESTLTTILATELAYQWLGHYSTPFPRANDVHITKALVKFVVSALKQDPNLEPSQAASRVIPPMGYSLYYEYSKRHPYSLIGSLKEEIRVAKTQWIFRMLNYTLTERVFVHSIRKFIQASEYKMFTEDDLLNVMTEVAWREGTLLEPILVAYIVDSWFRPDRFPVVTVTRNYDEHTADIEQHMFLRERPHDAPNKDKQLWWVPIMLMTRDDMDVSTLTTITWMQEQREISIADMPSEDAFVVVNPEEIGMFMVNYDAANWRLLAEYLEASAAKGSGLRPLPALTRAKLVHDAWNLLLAGELAPAPALAVMRFLAVGTERDPRVWDAFFNAADHLGRRLSGTYVDDKFKLFVRRLVTPLYESEPDSKLGRLAKHALCAAGYPPCIEESLAAFSAWTRMEDPDEGNPVAESYMSFVFMWGPLKLWEFGLERWLRFPASRRQSERTFLLKELAGGPTTQNKMLRLLNVSLLEDTGNFTESDIRLLLLHMGSSQRGSEALLHFLSDNWDAVKKRCEGNPALWEYLISATVDGFKTQEGLDMVSQLYVSRVGQFGPAEMLLEDALRTIREEAEWSTDNLPRIAAWLDGYLGLTSAAPTTAAASTSANFASTPASDVGYAL
ncbi:aminopeptidase N-like [Schistocerca serialis cubense]|uniref:aminopeptidase N-like n=1 Tax=Schistocerca serialis cubense TaxID=2023355 RepID=UPI00214F20C2|nr:aminopeptidase N-like [Schistocerca serialis cubense]